MTLTSVVSAHLHRFLKSSHFVSWGQKCSLTSYRGSSGWRPGLEKTRNLNHTLTTRSSVKHLPSGKRQRPIYGNSQRARRSTWRSRSAPLLSSNDALPTTVIWKAFMSSTWGTEVNICRMKPPDEKGDTAKTKQYMSNLICAICRPYFQELPSLLTWKMKSNITNEWSHYDSGSSWCNTHRPFEWDIFVPGWHFISPPLLLFSSLVEHFNIIRVFGKSWNTRTTRCGDSICPNNTERVKHNCWPG